MRPFSVLSGLVLGAAASPLNPLLPRQDVCSGFEFSSGDAAKDKDLWDKTGAGKFLGDFLAKGVTDWSDNFFKQVVAGGTQLGTTHDCGAFPSDGTCNGPDETPCNTYHPPETFYVHLAMHNLYAAFSTMHEKMQDNAIIDIASTSSAITAKYGPLPPEQSPDLFALLIGVAVFASLFKEFAAPAGFMIGALNLMAGGSKATPAATDPNTFRAALQDASGKIFKVLADQLEQTVKGIFTGSFTTSGGKVDGKDPAQFIADTFADGVLVDKKLVDPMVDKWNQRSASLMKDAILRTAWGHMENPISMMVTKPGVMVQDPNEQCDSFVGCTQKIPMDEHECIRVDGRIWKPDDGCIGFATTTPDSFVGPQTSYMSRDDFLDLAGFIGDAQAAMENALDCIKAGSQDDAGIIPTGKPDPDIGGIDLANPPVYPKCFWNLGFTWIKE